MRIAMLLHKSVEHDSRVRREARALAEAGHEVTVLHLPRVRGDLDGELDGFEVRSVTPRPWVRVLLPFGLYRAVFLVAFVRAVHRLHPHVVHAHDVAMLAPGAIGARLAGADLVYDSHEYAGGVPYRERGWALFVTALERVTIRRCVAVVTVSDGIADRLRDRYGLARRPVVVRNVPTVATGDLRSGGLRNRLGVGAVPIVLHQGAIAPGRGCEQLVLALRELPDAHLVFLGDGWPGHRSRVQGLVHELGLGARVHFVPSVPIDQLPAHTADATVGVSLLDDSCENHRLALPNKVFEYVAARVPVVASDLPELRALVQGHRLGWLVDPKDPSHVARALRAAIEGREEVLPHLDRARRELNWELESNRLTDIYDRLGDHRGRRTALVLVRNAVTYDARVMREAQLLRDLGRDVHVVGVASSAAEPGDEVVAGLHVRRLAPRLGLGWLRRLMAPIAGGSPWPVASSPTRPMSPPANRPPVRHAGSVDGALRRVSRVLVTADWYRRGIGEVRRTRPELVHCNDYNTMWIGVVAKLGYGARVIYDSHELWPDRNLRPEWRRWLMACEALFVRLADQTITTSPGYADVIARRYRVSRPVVVRNVPDLPAVSAVPAVDEGQPLAVYFGAITSGRGLEHAIRLLAQCRDLRLRLVGPDAWGYRDHVDRFAQSLGVRERVDILPPVSPSQMREAVAGASVALALIEPTCLSYRLTLPNKLFEYIAAGLPIVASNLPVIADFIESAGVGVVVDLDEPGSLERGVKAALDPTENTGFRQAARIAARTIPWRSEAKVLADVYQGTSMEPAQ